MAAGHTSLAFLYLAAIAILIAGLGSIARAVKSLLSADGMDR
jgi:hypothetical protein